MPQRCTKKSLVDSVYNKPSDVAVVAKAEIDKRCKKAAFELKYRGNQIKQNQKNCDETALEASIRQRFLVSSKYKNKLRSCIAVSLLKPDGPQR